MEMIPNRPKVSSSHIIRSLSLAFVFGCLLTTNLSGQIKMGDNPNDINSSSLLELESTTKGFLWPRMTTTQRDNIVMPPTGLTIFNIESVCVEVNVGTPTAPSWLCLRGDSDNQDVTQFSLNGDILTISIEGGNTQVVSIFHH